MNVVKFPMKKTALIIAIAISGLSLSSLVFAASNKTADANGAIAAGGNGKGSSANGVLATGITQAIDRLGDKIQALAMSAMGYVNSMTYQFDSDLPGTVKANTDNTVSVDGKDVTPSQFANLQANETTQKNTDNSLAQIAFAITPPKSNYDNQAEIDAYNQYKNKNSMTSLTQGIKASDSPFYSSRYVSFISNPDIRRAIAKADNETLDNNNKIFNYGNVITPITYTPAEALAASRFIQYATKDFTPLTNGIDFSPMKNANADQLAALVQSDAFQQYQVNVRNTVANRSIISNILNGLIAERKANANFSIDNGKAKNASPLAVEQYIATRRTNSPQWYKNMATASPATIQRETLFVLAEIEKQNFQAHLDRERLLSAMTAVAISAGQANQMASAEDAQKVGDEIKQVMNIKPSQKDQQNYKKYDNQAGAKFNGNSKEKKKAKSAL